MMTSMAGVDTFRRPWPPRDERDSNEILNNELASWSSSSFGEGSVALAVGDAVGWILPPQWARRRWDYLSSGGPARVPPISKFR